MKHALSLALVAACCSCLKTAAAIGPRDPAFIPRPTNIPAFPSKNVSNKPTRGVPVRPDMMRTLRRSLVGSPPSRQWARTDRIISCQESSFPSDNGSPSVENPIIPATFGGNSSSDDDNDDGGAAAKSRRGKIWDEWKERLRRVSNVASILCVLDCTILPAVTLVLPLIGVAASPAQAQWLHSLGHSVALFFVMPVRPL